MFRRWIFLVLLLSFLPGSLFLWQHGAWEQSNRDLSDLVEKCNLLIEAIERDFDENPTYWRECSHSNEFSETSQLLKRIAATADWSGYGVLGVLFCALVILFSFAGLWVARGKRV